MMTLLVILIPIALLDSLSIVPLCLIPLSVIFASKKPVANTVGLLAGISVVYVAGGLAILLGLDAMMDSIRPAVSRWWTDPNTLELIVQLLLGVVMLLFGAKAAKAQVADSDQRRTDAVSPGRAIVVGGGLVVGSFPGALPYFGAIDQILRHDLSLAGNSLVILFYNLMFIMPLISFAIVWVAFPAYSERIFSRVSNIFDKYGSRAFAYVLVLLGFILVVDSAGWFFGIPLIPVE